jgi:hypothetical protein
MKIKNKTQEINKKTTPFNQALPRGFPAGNEGLGDESSSS